MFCLKKKGQQELLFSLFLRIWFQLKKNKKTKTDLSSAFLKILIKFLFKKIKNKKWKCYQTSLVE